MYSPKYQNRSLNVKRGASVSYKLYCQIVESLLKLAIAARTHLNAIAAIIRNWLRRYILFDFVMASNHTDVVCLENNYISTLDYGIYALRIKDVENNLEQIGDWCAR